MSGHAGCQVPRTFGLYYIEDMDYKQISEIMRIPVPTAAIRLKRGRVALQKAYNSLNLKI